MVPTVKRNPELNRLYFAVGLAVVIWVIFTVYKLLSAQVDSGLDAPSRWALLALGLANVLAIGTLLFIVARSLAKLYFERRSGILGSRLRTRLVSGPVRRGHRTEHHALPGGPKLHQQECGPLVPARDPGGDPGQQGGFRCLPRTS